MRQATQCVIVCADPALVLMLNSCVEQAGQHSVWRCSNIRQVIRQLTDQGDDIDLLLLDVRLCQDSLVADIQAILKQQTLNVLLCVAPDVNDQNEIFTALANGAMHVLELDAEAGTEMQHKAVRVLKNSSRRLSRSAVMKPAYERRRLERHSSHHTTLVLIGASTGGPSAIVQTLQAVNCRDNVAIVLVQHLDEVFSASMSAWMDQQVDWPVRKACDGECLHAGEVVLLSGDCHWLLNSHLKLCTSREDHGFFMPSINTFMFSLIANWHQPAIGVVLTGMGKDGAAGLAAMQKQGWHTLAQDEASSAVYGMPRAAAVLGAADQILPPTMIGREIDLLLKQAPAFKESQKDKF